MARLLISLQLRLALNHLLAEALALTSYIGLSVDTAHQLQTSQLFGIKLILRDHDDLNSICVRSMPAVHVKIRFSSATALSVTNIIALARPFDSIDWPSLR